MDFPSKDSPPSTPPSPTNDDNKTHSRKREREISLEPANGIPKDEHERKDPTVPAKKNKTAPLDATQEEASSDSSGSPQSSPKELKKKVRQISQGVEDLSWQNMNRVPADADVGSADTCLDKQQDIGTPANSQNNQEVAESLERPASEEKGVKRKFLERGTSSGPVENGGPSQPTSEPLKRPRDDPDTDDNPRESKRPTPPPSDNAKRPKSPPPSPKKTSGFGAWSGSSSPFASVKGPSLFGNSPNSPSPPAPPVASGSSAASFVAASSSSSLASNKPDAPPATTTPAKRSGFDAFASNESPFASVARAKSPVIGARLNRSKSPPRRAAANPANISAFTAYATGGAHGFSLPPAQKRARAGSPDDGSSPGPSLDGKESKDEAKGPPKATEEDPGGEAATFEEQLRAGKDEASEEETKVTLTEQQVSTGEEDEDTLYQVRGKLFTLVENQWKEKGTGQLKINVSHDGSYARLVMRKEAVFALLLNVTLFPGMRVSLAQDPRYIRFSVIESGSTTHYNLRVSNAKIAQELLEEITIHLPST